jgi:hypothetical protein
MRTTAAILFLMVTCAMAQVPSRVMDDLMWQATKIPAAAPASSYLTDRTYFNIVTASNGLPLTVGITDGTTTTIEWGDGETTNNVPTSVTHTYATAGSYQMTIRGGLTAFTFSTATRGRVREILTPFYGMTNLTSLANSFNTCSNLIGSIPDLSALTELTTMVDCFRNCTNLTGGIHSLTNKKLTTLNGAFYFCNNLTGNIPSLSALTNLVIMGDTFAICSKLTGSIPSLSANTKLKNLNNAFYSCTLLTGHYPTLDGLTALTNILAAFYNTQGMIANTSTVAYIFGPGNFTNLVTAAWCFNQSSGAYASLLGNGSDFTNKTFAATFTVGSASTNSSYHMFYNQTTLTDYTALGTSWR